MREMITGTLTTELRDVESPVRRWLDAAFPHAGLVLEEQRLALAAQQKWWEDNHGAGSLPVERPTGEHAMIGTAADWLLRFMVHPRPSLAMARAGAEHARAIGVDVDAALEQLAGTVDVPLDAKDEPFQGPVPGNATDPHVLIRACWALAVLTEGYRGGPDALRRRPEITRLRHCRRISADELLSLTPPEAGYQLATLMDSFDCLIDRLRQNPGLWCVGPRFPGSVWIPADGDLVAGGLLVDLKTSARPELPLTDLYQLVSYALLDFGNQHRIGSVAYYSARFLHLGGWHLQPLLSKMAGRPMTVDWAQGEFGEMVLKATPGGHESYRESARALSRTVRVYL